MINSLQKSETIHQALLKVNLSTSGTNYTRAKNLILNNGISLLPPIKNIIPEKYFCIDCGKEIKTNSKRCPECANIAQRQVARPDRETLKQLIRSTPFTIIGECYGVSDNAIRKWCITYNLPSKKKDIIKYTNEEWGKI